jgi:ATP-dependent Lon protease
MHLDEKKKLYCTGKTSYSKIFTTLGIETAKTLLGTGVSTALSVLANRYLNQGPAGQAASIALFSSISIAIGSGVNNVVYAIQSSTLTLEEGLKQVHEELKAESASLVATLPSQIQERLEAHDATISQLIHEKKGEAALNCLRRREAVLLSLPTKIMNVAQYDKLGDERLEAALQWNIDHLLGRYPEPIREPLSLFVQAVRDNSILKTGKRVQAFLYGPSGTGKTTFVKLLGEATGLPVCYVELSKIEAKHELLGSEQTDPICAMKDSVLLGKIGNCFVEAGVLNPIIFFDEAGEYLGESEKSHQYDFDHMKKQMIQSVFKKLLDPNQGLLDLAGLGISFDATRATYVFASNYKLNNAALLSRMPQIHFERLTLAEKESALNVAFAKKMDDLRDVMKESEVEDIRKTASAYLPYLLAEDNKLNPGARIIQEVSDELIGHIRELKVRERKLNKALIATDKIESFIQESLKRRQPLSPEAVKS